MHSLTQSRDYLRDREGYYPRDRDHDRDRNRERYRDSRGQHRYLARSCKSIQFTLLNKILFLGRLSQADFPG